jgi:hypothetical protein
MFSISISSGRHYRWVNIDRQLLFHGRPAVRMPQISIAHDRTP